MEKRISIINIPEISAIYFALLQCGYDYYAIEKEAGLVERIEKFRATKGDFNDSFFDSIRQNTCEVYPYWPRAATLETATFFLASDSLHFKDFNAYQKGIMSASNISDVEREQAFWDWVKDFPAALKSVLVCNEFQAYLDWENEWIEQQNRILESDLQHIHKILKICVKSYPSPVQSISIALNPIKCAYSADYHMAGNELVFCSGAFKLESVIHEFLHHVVHPFIGEHRNAVKRHMPYPDIDSSYYLGGDENGKLNAFEEHVVRKLTGKVVMFDFPPNLGKFINDISCSC